jgi:hypothetical protein
LTTRPDITLKKGIHPKENVVCVAFAYNLQRTDALKGKTPGRWNQSVGSRCISENNEDENHSGERRNHSDVSENYSGVSRMNYFSQKLHFHTLYWSINVIGNKEINVIHIHIR